MNIKTKTGNQLFKRVRILAFTILSAFLILCTSCNYPGSGTEVAEEVIPRESTPTTDSDVGIDNTPIQQTVLLYATQESEDWATHQVKDAVIALAEEYGLGVESITHLSDEDLQSDVSLVFLFEDDPGIVNFASRFPQIQFIGVGVPNVTPSSNISVIGENGLRKDQQAFVAGYIAAMVAEDWRAGVVSFGAGEENSAIEEGFLNGARYFCGLCRPAFPPFYEYPQALHLDINAQSWESIIGIIGENKLGVIYLAPVGIFETSVNEWTHIDSVIIGDGPRPKIVPESQWMAAVQFTVSEGLQSIWNDLLAGNGGHQIQWELQIVEVNRDLLSIGREREARALIDDLAAGFVDTGVELQAE